MESSKTEPKHQGNPGFNVKDKKGKGRPLAPPDPAIIIDLSATEESGDDAVVRVKKEEQVEYSDRLASSENMTNQGMNQSIHNSSESEMSEDISPLDDPAGYRAQLERRCGKKVSD